MSNRKTDSSGFATQNPDKQRDDAAKGGPVTGPGNPDNRHAVSSPYNEDLQTQIAAKGGKKKQDKKKNESL